MTTEADPGAVTRIPLSRERVLRAAVTMADAQGIEALTMRKLAQELGVEAMSLYHHVAKKDDLLAGILDLVVSEIALPEGPDWKAALRTTAISAYTVLLSHPWASSLMMSIKAVSLVRLRWMEAVLRCLREGGFSAKMTHHAYHALDSHITGFTLWVASIMANKDDLASMGAAFLQEFPIETYPYLIEHIQWHIDHPEEGAAISEFEFGLNLILDGLERLREG